MGHVEFKLMKRGRAKTIFFFKMSSSSRNRDGVEHKLLSSREYLVFFHLKGASQLVKLEKNDFSELRRWRTIIAFSSQLCRPKRTTFGAPRKYAYARN